MNRPDIDVVDNDPKYHEFIRILRNDPRVADGFLERVQITAEQQAAYMERNAHCYVVARCGGIPVGYAGVVDDDLRICVHPNYQSQGIGEILLQTILQRFPKAQVRIKWGNEASLRLFAKFGFRPYLIVMAGTAAGVTHPS
jgi:GNAT superfamily N-acetyltransferase